VITFDEYLAPLDKLDEKFMISPPLIKKPDIELKGKSLFIEFTKRLKTAQPILFILGMHKRFE